MKNASIHGGEVFFFFFKPNKNLQTKPFDSLDPNKLWKILKEMGIPDHLTCLLRNLLEQISFCCFQEATGHGTTDWFQIRKGVCQGCVTLLI